MSRVLKLDSKALSRKERADAELSKDLKKRSLNFHQFSIVEHRNTEVAQMEFMKIRENRAITQLNPKQILGLFTSDIAPGLNSSTYPHITDTLLSNFLDIPPSIYPKILSVLSSYASESSKIRSLFTRIFSRISSTSSLPEIYSEDSKDWCTIATAASTFPSKSALKCRHLACTNLSCFPSETHLPSTLNYLSQLPSLIRSEKSLFRSIRSQLTLLLDTTTPVPRLALFTTNPVASPEDVLHQVELFTKILTKLNPPKYTMSKYYTSLHHFITRNHLDSIRVISILARHAHVQHLNWLAKQRIMLFLKSHKNLAFVPNDSLSAVSSAANAVGFNHSFLQKRLNNAFPSHPQNWQKSSNIYSLSHDERLRRLVSLGRLGRIDRQIRNKIHAIINLTNPGRISPCLTNVVIPTCKHSTCAICQKFQFNLSLAKMFNIVI